MANGKFIRRDEADGLVAQGKEVDSTIRPIVEQHPETPQNQNQVKKAKRLVRNHTEGYVFDLGLVKQLLKDHTDDNSKYLVVMRGMDDPKSTVILGVANGKSIHDTLDELTVLGDEPAMLQHPRGIRITEVSLQKQLVGGDILTLKIEKDDNDGE